MGTTVEPGIVAILALVAWIPSAVVIGRRLRPPMAAAVAAIVAVLVLPEQVSLFDLPVLPPFDKQVVASFGLLLAALVSPWRGLFDRLSRRELFVVLALIALAALGTFMTNRDELEVGLGRLPPLGPNDVLAMIARDVVTMLIPFYVAKAVYRRAAELRDLLVVMVGAALVYSGPALVEMWLSPQFHNWVYGFHQHEFLQTRREGGWRPMVFMAHGLDLAVFLAGAAIAAAALAKQRVAIFRVGARLWTAALAVVLVLCKSLGAIAYGVVLLPLVWLSKSGRLSLWVAAALAVVALTFPWSRATGLFPTESLVAGVARLNEERAASLAFRFENEDELLEKAEQRPLFGWGLYGRAWIYDYEGRSESVTDGWWIIQYGTRGIVGFLFAFGLLLHPVVNVLRRWPRFAGREDQLVVATASLLVGLRAAELLPNGLFSFLPFFLAGALAGVVAGEPAPAAATPGEGVEAAPGERGGVRLPARSRPAQESETAGAGAARPRRPRP